MTIEHTQHPWTDFRSQELEWIPGDSLEQWHQNMKDPERRKVLEKYGWDLPGVITYKLNQHGFRCKEFTDDPGVITLGCSFTAGLALPVDHIWPSLVAKSLDLELWNLGVPGVGMDTCFRLFNHYITHLNAKIVCMLRPPQNRFEWVQENGEVEFVTPNSYSLINKHKPAQLVWFQHQQNCQQNYLKNTMAIQYLCMINKVKLVFLDLRDDLFNTPPRDPWPPARDLCHVGTVEHAECARRFLSACAV
jgi:hypothetical protein